MQGMCTSPLPVGIAAYTAAKLPHQTYSSLSLGVRAHPDTPHSNPSRTQGSSPGTLAAFRATPESPVALGNKHNHQGPLRLQQLGFHANAAWDPTPELAGCGPLLPSWRQVADLLVPLLHKVKLRQAC